MRYYLVIDSNLSSYYLSGESLLEALDKGKLSRDGIEGYYEVGVEDYIHKPFTTSDNINPDLLSPKVDPDLCPYCETGTIHRTHRWFDKNEGYEYCDYCDYTSLEEPEENDPCYYTGNIGLEYLPY